MSVHIGAIALRQLVMIPGNLFTMAVRVRTTHAWAVCHNFVIRRLGKIFAALFGVPLVPPILIISLITSTHGIVRPIKCTLTK